MNISVLKEWKWRLKRETRKDIKEREVFKCQPNDTIFHIIYSGSLKSKKTPQAISFLVLGDGLEYLLIHC